jgi:hypothetical protein
MYPKDLRFIPKFSFLYDINMTSRCYIFNDVSWGRDKMKRKLLSVMNISRWKTYEKLFVISMMLMSILNFFIVGFMLYDH